MKLDIARVDVYSANVPDRPGELAKKLAVLSDAGADIEFLLARPGQKRGGKGVAYVAPVKGAAQSKAARKARFTKTNRITVLRVEGANRAGLGAKMTKAVGDAGVNIREISTVTTGRKFVVHFVLDGAAEATKAARALHAL